jgi:hypothetical protein
MKRQYFGDSKDCFKWDYHHYLVNALGYRQLQIVLMMTPDDDGSDGGTPPERFPARLELLSFCNDLRRTREPADLANLPKKTSAGYEVRLYKPYENLTNSNRVSYFSNITDGPDQVLFLDPDNGFEPESSFNEKHVRYAEVEHILSKLSANSIVTVFQHHRRKTFDDDFSCIRKRLISCGNSTAICWHSLMFVSISSSPTAISHVQQINDRYAAQRPVRTLV